MDHEHFDRLARSFGAVASRRGLARVLAGGGFAAVVGTALDTLAGNARTARRRKGKKRKNRKRSAPPTADCTPEALSTTCAGRCGTATNSCGQSVNCTCPGDQQCLVNGSCAIVCDDNTDCDSGGCNGCSGPSVEGGRHCIVGPVNPLVLCTSTADCPRSTHCQDIGVKVCVQLCT